MAAARSDSDAKKEALGAGMENFPRDDTAISGNDIGEEFFDKDGCFFARVIGNPVRVDTGMSGDDVCEERRANIVEDKVMDEDKVMENRDETAMSGDDIGEERRAKIGEDKVMDEDKVMENRDETAMSGDDIGEERRAKIVEDKVMDEDKVMENRDETAMSGDDIGEERRAKIVEDKVMENRDETAMSGDDIGEESEKNWSGHKEVSVHDVKGKNLGGTVGGSIGESTTGCEADGLMTRFYYYVGIEMIRKSVDDLQRAQQDTKESEKNWSGDKELSVQDVKGENLGGTVLGSIGESTTGGEADGLMTKFYEDFAKNRKAVDDRRRAQQESELYDGYHYGTGLHTYFFEDLTVYLDDETEYDEDESEEEYLDLNLFG